jgi:hypothetical protein
VAESLFEGFRPLHYDSVTMKLIAFSLLTLGGWPLGWSSACIPGKFLIMHT